MIRYDPHHVMYIISLYHQNRKQYFHIIQKIIQIQNDYTGYIFPYFNEEKSKGVASEGDFVL